MKRRSKISVKKRNGGSMAEAALVFPIVILAAVSLMYICIDMYEAAILNSEEHIELRQAADRRSEEMIDFCEKMRSSAVLKYESRGLITRSGEKMREYEVYALDEGKYVRCKNAAKEVL